MRTCHLMRLLRRLTWAGSICRSAGTASRAGKTRVSLIPGDGIGPEISAAVVRIFEAAKAPVDFEMLGTDFGPDGLLPKSVIDSIRTNKIGLKGIF